MLNKLVEQKVSGRVNWNSWPSKTWHAIQAKKELVHFRQGEIWRDYNGVHINAHGDGLLHHKLAAHVQSIAAYSFN